MTARKTGACAADRSGAGMFGILETLCVASTDAQAP